MANPRILFNNSQEIAATFIYTEGKFQEEEMRFCAINGTKLAKACHTRTIPNADMGCGYEVTMSVQEIQFSCAAQLKVFFACLKSRTLTKLIEAHNLLEQLDNAPSSVIQYLKRYICTNDFFLRNKIEKKELTTLESHRLEEAPSSSRRYKECIELSCEVGHFCYYALPNETDPIIVREIRINDEHLKISFDSQQQIESFESGLRKGYHDGLKQAYETLLALYESSNTNCQEKLVEIFKQAYLSLPEMRNTRLTPS